MRDEFGLERVVPGSVYRWLAREYDLDVLDDEAQELLISHDQVDSDCAWPDDEDWPYKDFEKDWDEFALEYDMSECDYSGVLWLDAWGLGFQYPEAEEIGFQPLSRKKPIKKRRSGRSSFAARFYRTSDRSWKRYRRNQTRIMIGDRSHR